MERSVGILMFLATALLTAECFSPFARRQDGPNGEPEFQPNACYSKLDQCTLSLQQNRFIGGVSTDYRELISNIDHICEQYFTVKECFTSSYQICPDSVQHQADIMISAADFVCSERGKELIREYQQSVCYEDPSKFNQFQRIYQLCGMELGVGFGGDPNPCQSASQMNRCGSSWLTRECGTAAGQLFDGLASRLLSVIANQDCPSQNANELLKRGLALLKKSL